MSSELKMQYLCNPLSGDLERVFYGIIYLIPERVARPLNTV